MIRQTFTWLVKLPLQFPLYNDVWDDLIIQVFVEHKV